MYFGSAFGPVEVFGRIKKYRLRYVSVSGGTIISRQGIQVLTEHIKDADPFGILLVPSGQAASTVLVWTSRIWLR